MIIYIHGLKQFECVLQKKLIANLRIPDGSYSIDDIQDYFEFIINKHKTLTENLSIKIYSNEIKNRIVFKIKNGCKLELLTPETMKLLGSTKKVRNS